MLRDENPGAGILVSRERQGLGLMLLPGLGNWKASLVVPLWTWESSIALSVPAVDLPPCFAS